jgi:hypothetical protein
LIMLFSHRAIEVPKGVDWSRRASPHRLAEEEAGALNHHYRRRVGEITVENIAFMRGTLTASNGLVTAYHGTTLKNADSIMTNGFENRENEEGGVGVSGWHSVVALEALRFARRRSLEAGVEGEGAIVELTMHRPAIDILGRLEWFTDAANTEPVRMYTPEELQERVGRVAVSHAQLLGWLPNQQGGAGMPSSVT